MTARGRRCQGDGWHAMAWRAHRDRQECQQASQRMAGRGEAPRGVHSGSAARRSARTEGIRHGWLRRSPAELGVDPTMPTLSEIEQQRAEDRRRDAWLDEQVADCRARFDLTLTTDEQADIEEDLACDRDGRTRAAAALAQRDAARQLGGVEWANIEGRAIVAQVEAWRIIEDAADRCAPAAAGENAGSRLRFYLHALAVRAELDGRDLNEAVSDAVFHMLAGDHAAKEVWRRLDEKDGEVGLWVGVLLSLRPQADAAVDRDAAQMLRRLRKVAWTYLREWVRNAAQHPDDRKTLGQDLDCELWREALTQTRGRTLAGALASALDGAHNDVHSAVVKDTPARPAAAEKALWKLNVTLVGREAARTDRGGL